MTVSVAVSLGAKPAQAEGSVELHIDLALKYSCTIVSLVTESSFTLDYSSNAVALVQVAS